MTPNINTTKTNRPAPYINTTNKQKTALRQTNKQVYKARLKSNGEYVAVKVQRPQMLETVSKGKGRCCCVFWGDAVVD